MNIVIFGGSFNPPHNAHLEMLKAAEAEEFVDKILILPANIPPHKAVGGDFAEIKHRIRMCEILASFSVKAEICLEEIERGGKSYMIDTVCALKNKYPEDRLYLLVGADMAVTLLNWYRGDELVKMVGVLSVGRNTVENGEYELSLKKLEELGCEVVRSDKKTEPISSTLVRRLLAEGEKELPLPKEIFDYISQNRLYKGN